MKMLQFLVLCGLVAFAQSSAIPMWEFLSKQEKMSYLYSMFANQVDEFCENTKMNDCNNELLKYGLGKLRDMPEDHLDTMDPYQRGANSIIWDSMMDGHEMMKKAPKIRTTVQTTTRTTKPNSYEDESFSSDEYDYDSPQPAASARIDNVYRLPPPKGFVYTIASGTPQYIYPKNFPQYIAPNTRTTYNQQQQPHRQHQQQQHEQSQHNNYERRYENVPLTGPMVFKVYPDGRPVREPTQPLPQDEDLRQYKMSKVQLPFY